MGLGHRPILNAPGPNLTMVNFDINRGYPNLTTVNFDINRGYLFSLTMGYSRLVLHRL